MFDKWINQDIWGSLTLLQMVNVLNCDLIAMMLFTLTLGDSYLPFLAYSCFPITMGLYISRNVLQRVGYTLILDQKRADKGATFRIAIYQEEDK